MAYLCPVHDIILACSKCHLQALPPERIDAAIHAVPERAWGVHLDYPRFEIPCVTCGRELSCFACMREVL